MKPLFLLLLIACLVVGTEATAQKNTPARPDLIHTHAGQRIEAKVEEISSREISYRKFDSPSGALYTIATAEVKRIEFPSGFTDEFDPVPNRLNTKDRGDEDPGGEKLKEIPVYATLLDKVTETEILGRRNYLKGKKPIELSSRGVTGLEYARLPSDSLLADARSPAEHAGLYEWQEKNFSGPNARVAWKVEWDNVNLVPKEWSGYSWRVHPDAEKAKLKQNQLYVGKDKIGEFVMFESEGKVIRGLLVDKKGGRQLFLWKVE